MRPSEQIESECELRKQELVEVLDALKAGTITRETAFAKNLGCEALAGCVFGGGARR